MDDGYAEAAGRRGRQTPGSLRPTPLLGVALLVVGLLLSAAAVQVHQRAEATGQTRERLLDEVDDRERTLDALEAEVVGLRQQVDAARSAELPGGGEGATAAVLTELQVVSGTVPVTGPGLRIVLDDAALTGGSPGLAGSAGSAGSAPVGSDGEQAPPGAGVEDGRVLDYDLQRVVDGLWAAGAEAVAVGGQRLTSLTAIRLAGDAIVVDYRPLSRPYVVTAIGDPDRLAARFADSDGGRYLQVLTQNYGVRADVETEAELRLPAATGVSLRHARPLQSRTEVSTGASGPPPRGGST